MILAYVELANSALPFFTVTGSKGLYLLWQVIAIVRNHWLSRRRTAEAAYAHAVYQVDVCELHEARPLRFTPMGYRHP